MPFFLSAALSTVVLVLVQHPLIDFPPHFVMHFLAFLHADNFLSGNNTMNFTLLGDGYFCIFINTLILFFCHAFMLPCILTHLSLVFKIVKQDKSSGVG